MESGGNPCAIGDPKAFGSDGNPREIGLVQLWNPDDFQALGLSQTDLRAPCGKGGVCSRPLTDAEMVEHGKAAIAFIGRCRDRALAALKGVGVSWGGRDPWILAKLVHAIPGLVEPGIEYVSKHLGHAPTSWDEFSSALADTTFDKGTEHYRWWEDPDHKLGPFGKLTSNARRTGAVVPATEA